MTAKAKDAPSVKPRFYSLSGTILRKVMRVAYLTTTRLGNGVRRFCPYQAFLPFSYIRSPAADLWRFITD